MEYIPAKTIISSYGENSSWFGFNYTMNIYKGCCHGCIYCDSRSECYHVDNFDTVRAKENTIDIIRHELKTKRKSGIVGTGAMSDPYNPFEEELMLTRQALELICENRFGISIATKSSLITRDIDILQKIKAFSPVLCKITITACDDDLCRKIEPNVYVSSERFSAIKKLSDAGIFSGVLLMPVLPFITDTEDNIIGIVRKANESGARFVYPAFGVTLRGIQRDYFYKKLDELFLDVKQKYIERFNDDYSCGSQYAHNLYKLFANECEKLGLLYKMPDIIKAYKSGYETDQLSMF